MRARDQGSSVRHILAGLRWQAHKQSLAREGQRTQQLLQTLESGTQLAARLQPGEHAVLTGVAHRRVAEHRRRAPEVVGVIDDPVAQRPVAMHRRRVEE